MISNGMVEDEEADYTNAPFKSSYLRNIDRLNSVDSQDPVPWQKSIL